MMRRADRVRSRAIRRVRPSYRVLQAAAMFGLAVDERGAARTRRAFVGAVDAVGVARQIDAALRPGQIALVTGPSGSGKSTILRALGARLTRRAVVVGPAWARPRWRDEAVIDQFRAPLPRALGLLARAGLAEARVLGRKPCELSDGERFRLMLALAMERAEEGIKGSGDQGNKARGRNRGAPTLIVDEFGSTLDRTTGASVARSLRRWIDARSARPPLRLVAATAHDDLLGPLGPDLLIYVPLLGRAEVYTR